MKKLFPTILVICSLLSGNAYSETFELSKCHSNKSPLKAINDYKNWNDYSKGENIKDNIYSINPSKETVTNLLIFDDLDKELKQRQSLWEIQKTVWGHSNDLETHTVETHIYRLRKKMIKNFEDHSFIKHDQDGYFIN